jgi:hypothetical protein
VVPIVAAIAILAVGIVVVGLVVRRRSTRAGGMGRPGTTVERPLAPIGAADAAYASTADPPLATPHEPGASQQPDP